MPRDYIDKILKPQKHLLWYKLDIHAACETEITPEADQGLF